MVESVSLFSKIMKGAYFILGTLALVLGVIGAFLPVIPTTPLILLAAWCYIRSSEKFYEWLINDKRFGKTILDYHERRGIAKKTKVKAIVMMWLMISISSYFFIPSVELIAFLYMIAVTVTIYIYRQPTLDETVPEAIIGE